MSNPGGGGGGGEGCLCSPVKPQGGSKVKAKTEPPVCQCPECRPAWLGPGTVRGLRGRHLRQRSALCRMGAPGKNGGEWRLLLSSGPTPRPARRKHSKMCKAAALACLPKGCCSRPQGR